MPLFLLEQQTFFRLQVFSVSIIDSLVRDLGCGGGGGVGHSDASNLQYVEFTHYDWRFFSVRELRAAGLALLELHSSHTEVKLFSFSSEAINMPGLVLSGLAPEKILQ